MHPYLYFLEILLLEYKLILSFLWTLVWSSDKSFVLKKDEVYHHIMDVLVRNSWNQNKVFVPWKNQIFLSLMYLSIYHICVCMFLKGNWMHLFMMRQCWTTWLEKMKDVNWWPLAVEKSLPLQVMALLCRKVPSGNALLILHCCNF